MPKKEAVTADSISVSTNYSCDACGFKTKDVSKFLEHERQVPHGLFAASYPCKMCGKRVVVVPDDPSVTPDVKGEKIKGILYADLKKEKAKITEARIQGGFGTCDHCKGDLKKALD